MAIHIQEKSKYFWRSGTNSVVLFSIDFFNCNCKTCAEALVASNLHFHNEAKSKAQITPSKRHETTQNLIHVSQRRVMVINGNFESLFSYYVVRYSVI